jgi:hypothetical protein
MRKAILLLVPLLAAPLAGQDFEGTVSMKMENQGVGAAEVTVHIRGDMSAFAITLPSGPPAGMGMRMIMNGSTRKVTMLMPAMPGMPLPAGSKGIKMVTDFPDQGDAGGKDADANVKVTALGTSQTIAGMKCDDYAIENNGQKMNMCVSTSMGSFRMPDMAGPGQRSAPPAWVRALGNKPMFPLKVWSTEGNAVAMEVTSVKRGSVPAEAFNENAPGYTDMSAMMGQMRRNN